MRSRRGSPSLRPLLPARCLSEATDHGGPIWPTIRTVPMSIPISRVLEQSVVIAPPPFMVCSVSSRTSLASEPWCTKKDSGYPERRQRSFAKFRVQLNVTLGVGEHQVAVSAAVLHEVGRDPFDECQFAGDFGLFRRALLRCRPRLSPCRTHGAGTAVPSRPPDP
jgi:hypothetical protein